MSKGITFTLSNGVQIPGLGFGTFSSEGSKGEAYAAVLHALRAGYRHLDCAWFYQNEDEIGDAIRDFLAENESVRRSDLFITTKVWNHLHEPADVKWSLNDSLQKLRLDYVDLFLVHWPIAAEKTEDHQPKIGSDGKVSSSSRKVRKWIAGSFPLLSTIHNSLAPFFPPACHHVLFPLSPDPPFQLHCAWA